MIRTVLAPYIIWIQLAVAAAIFGAGWYFSGLSGKAEIADMKATYEQGLAEASKAETAAVNRARVAEQAASKAMAQVATNYEQGRADAQDDADRTIAELRAGNRKLRQHWEAARATASLSGAVAAASGLDGQARLREEGIGRVLREVGACQAHVIGLQEAVRAYAE